MLLFGLINLAWFQQAVKFYNGSIKVAQQPRLMTGCGGGKAAETAAALETPEPEPLDPADKAGADGRVDIQTLRSGLEWCKANASYNTPYDEIAARFGVHGKAIESLFEGSTIYRWWATEDAYVQITFTVKDGLELWNVTQYNGL